MTSMIPSCYFLHPLQGLSSKDPQVQLDAAMRLLDFVRTPESPNNRGMSVHRTV